MAEASKPDTPEPALQVEQLKTKTPPDPEKIQALLQMAEMQAMGSAAGRRPPYKPLIIVTVLIVLVTIASYAVVVWASHQ